jgi:hypothetical protein
VITAELMTCMYSPNFLLCARSHTRQILRAVMEDCDSKTLEQPYSNEILTVIVFIQLV